MFHRHQQPLSPEPMSPICPGLSEDEIFERYGDVKPVPSPTTSTSSSDSSSLSPGTEVAPGHGKTTGDREKRLKNNLASRNSRKKKKEKYEEMERRMAKLEKENCELRQKLQRMMRRDRRADTL